MDFSIFYVLDDEGINPIPATNLEVLSRCLDEGRQVKISFLPNGSEVSTVFLAIAHGRDDKGAPILWETAIISKEGIDVVARCTGNRYDAEKMHQGILDDLEDIHNRQ